MNCSFTVSASDAGTFDSFNSPTQRTGGYLERTVTYTPTAGEETLVFTLICPRFLQLTAQNNFALDAIRLTSDGGVLVSIATWM